MCVAALRLWPLCCRVMPQCDARACVGTHSPFSTQLEGAWIRAETEPTQAVEYRAEDGFDVVVDGARFLPETVTLSRVTVKVRRPPRYALPPRR